jgi:hypothetical protein
LIDRGEAKANQMKVLDVYAEHSWSFEAENYAALQRLRAAACLEDAQGRAAQLARLGYCGAAYKLVGNAVNLELANHFFDELHVRFVPTGAERTLLAQIGARWLKALGRISLPQNFPQRGPSAPPSLSARIAQAVRFWTDSVRALPAQ